MSEPASPRDRLDVGGWLADLSLAASFLTRLRPPGTPPDLTPGRLAGAVRAFPLIGAGVGLAGGIVYALAYWLGLPPFAAALCAVAATALATGALHEDGLADTADGLGGGQTAEDRLRIMRDSHIGAFGVLALVFSVGLRTAALATLGTPALVAAALIAGGAGSRALLGPLMRRLDPARADGLAVNAGRPSEEGALTAAVIGAAFALLFLGLGTGIVAAAAACVAAAAVGQYARRGIGGYTGDVLGAAQQAAEVAILLVAAAALGSA
jgi:adenosylcobinamide-GDP ribazoletransferase